MCAGWIRLRQQCQGSFQIVSLTGRVLARQIHAGVAQTAQLRQVRQVEARGTLFAALQLPQHFRRSEIGVTKNAAVELGVLLMEAALPQLLQLPPLVGQLLFLHFQIFLQATQLSPKMLVMLL